MSFLDVVLAIVAANVLLAVVSLVLGLGGLAILVAWAATKERRLLRRLGVRKLGEYRYVSQRLYVITPVVGEQVGLLTFPELMENGVFVLREYARSPEAVGKPDQNGRVYYTLDRWCGDGYNIRTVKIDPRHVGRRE